MRENKTWKTVHSFPPKSHAPRLTSDLCLISVNNTRILYGLKLAWGGEAWHNFQLIAALMGNAGAT